MITGSKQRVKEGNEKAQKAQEKKRKRLSQAKVMTEGKEK